MIGRKKFLKLGMLGAGLFLTNCTKAEDATENHPGKPSGLPGFDPENAPVVISTWNHGRAANAAAWKVLSGGGAALDAVELGVMATESDPKVTSVGLGGLPDRDGHVTLDACIMDADGNCGGVAFLRNIEHPIAVARKVMTETPHVLLVGEGAYAFARAQGFPHRDLLTEEARKAWEDWKRNAHYEPVPNRENHDTIGMLALDGAGNLAGACTTSGMAWKIHGRVGDSPIIGAGLFVDNEVGAACATGLGEAVVRIAGSHLVVELMRQGHAPAEACRLAVERLVRKHRNMENLQVGFIALNKAGAYGGYAVRKGFNFAMRTKTDDSMIDAKFQLRD